MGCIVVGVDRSDTARRAAERAAALAASLGHDLHLVMCAERSKGVQMSVGSDTFHSDWLSSAQQYLQEVGRQLPHQSVTSSVSDDDPASAIVEEANRLNAELIVVGNRRVQGLARVLGSVAGDVMKRADCDVYVANTTADPDDA